ncbi:MAG: CHAT domain-containing tetratricopeptide repeat protein [Saprospiraceae bacterium]
MPRTPLLCTLLFWLLSLSLFAQAQAPADTAAASALYRESDKLIDGKQFRAATERLWEASRLLEEGGSTETALYAAVLHQRGVVFIMTRMQPDSAIRLNEKALAIREKLFGYHSDPVFRSLQNIGQGYVAHGDFKKALDYSNQALAVAKSLPPGHEESAASAYNNNSIAHINLNNHQAALLYADSALHIREQAKPVDSMNLAISYNNMGALQVLVGNYDRAVLFLEKGLALRTVLLGKWHPEVAATTCNLGAAAHFAGDNERALDLLQTALDIRRKAPPPDEIEMAESYANLMLPLVPLGDYDRAIEYGQQALAICKKLGGRGIAIKAIVHMAWGNALVHKNALDAALEQYRLALEVFSLTRNALAAAEALNNMSGVYAQKRDFQNQKKYVRQALERKRVVQNNHPDLAVGFVNLGLAFQNAGQQDSTLLYLDSAEAHLLRTFGPGHPYFATLHNVRAVSLARQGDNEAALTELERAKRANHYDQRGVFRRVTQMDNLLVTLTAAGAILREQHLERARDAFLEAYSGVEYLRSAPFERGSQTALNSRVFPLHEALIAVDMALAEQGGSEQYRQEAFRFAESAKSFTLFQAVRNSGAERVSDLPQHIAEQEAAQRAAVQRLEKQCLAAKQKIPLDEAGLDSLLNLLVAEKDAYRALQQNIRQQHPDYYALKHPTAPESVATAQSLLASDQTLLEYFVGDSGIFLFVLRPDTFVVREIRRDFPLEDWVGQFLHGLYGHHTTPDARKSDSLRNACLTLYIEFGRKLYEKLVAPVAEWLTDQGSVILVPDGPLSYIPFDALLTDVPKDLNNFKKYPYLFDRYRFSYAYSATLLREMRDKQHRHEPAKPFLAFAPFFSDDTLAPAGYRNFDPLPYSGAEVSEAQKIMGGDIVCGTEATKARFVETAGGYRVLHLATHGVADDRMGDNAYLAFSETPDSIENELLYAKEQYGLSLNADLVVFSACETGVGEFQRGEGIVSLARAFAFAGAKSIVTTLWRVNGKSTSVLMPLFYAELSTGKSKDEALRSARVRYLENATVKSSHPFYWAAFVPVGDMRPLR